MGLWLATKSRGPAKQQRLLREKANVMRKRNVPEIFHLGQTYRVCADVRSLLLPSDVINDRRPDQPHRRCKRVVGSVATSICDVWRGCGHWLGKYAIGRCSIAIAGRSRHGPVFVMDINKSNISLAWSNSQRI